jgi:hypothetical protein
MGAPWAMLSICGRPLIEYWIEFALRLGVDQCLVVAGDGGEKVTSFLEDGARYGIQVSYAFPGSVDTSKLNESPQGVFLLLQGPLFPFLDAVLNPIAPGDRSFKFQSSQASLEITQGDRGKAVHEDIRTLGIQPLQLDSVKDFYAISMRLLDSRLRGYLTPGYSLSADGSFIGMDTITPASCKLMGPLVIGNRCRFGVMTNIGPSAIIGNHVVVDTKTEISRSIILDSTYIGRSLDIIGKVVAGNKIIDPEDGEILELSEAWIVEDLREKSSSDILLHSFGRLAAFFLLLLLTPLYWILGKPLAMLGQFRMEPARILNRSGKLISYLQVTGSGMSYRIFSALLFDLRPFLVLAVQGHIGLCGCDPVSGEAVSPQQDLSDYYPGAFTYGLARGIQTAEPELAEMDRHFYAGSRSLLEDLRILTRCIKFRLFGIKSL